MSLSKQIIYGSEKDVADFLAQNPKLDEIDEYGYTPLVQTAIVNSAEKAKLLLEAGADAKFTDLTGRSALHWAADNNNLQLCDLLLKHGANANSYTTAGQSVSVTPLLRKNNKIKNILINSNNADLDFAQDFINAKTLGHRFELQGRADIVNHENTFIEMEFEGFYLEFSLDIVSSSLVDFEHNYGGKHLQKFFPKINKIIRALKIGLELIKYQNYLIDIEKYKNRIDQLLNEELLLLPVAFTGHAITFIKFWNWLIRCDRGAYGKENGPVIFYKINNEINFNKDFVKQLLYKRQHEKFINEGLIKHLRLEKKFVLPLSLQSVGNCSWANVEAAVPAILFLLLFEETSGNNFEKTQQAALYFHNEWVEWDKNRALDFCWQSFYEGDKVRKASRASILAAILFQACSYENKQDLPKARKILSVLNLPEYKYILDAYLKVFSKDKNNPHIKNFKNFIDDFSR